MTEMASASVLDVAAYMLSKRGAMTAMKLQKLVYYSQAWSLVWDDEPLFQERIEAWADGPVCPDLYSEHRGKFRVDLADVSRGKPNRLDKTQKETVDAVLATYGDKSPQWLVDLTHSEEPWVSARGKLKPGERGTNEISHASMAEYYGSL